MMKHNLLVNVRGIISLVVRSVFSQKKWETMPMEVPSNRWCMDSPGDLGSLQETRNTHLFSSPSLLSTTNLGTPWIDRHVKLEFPTGGRWHHQAVGGFRTVGVSLHCVAASCEPPDDSQHHNESVESQDIDPTISCGTCSRLLPTVWGVANFTYVGPSSSKMTVLKGRINISLSSISIQVFGEYFI